MCRISGFLFDMKRCWRSLECRATNTLKSRRISQECNLDMNRIERYATGTAEVTSSLPPSEFPLPASLPLDRPHSPATSMQTTAATYADTIVDQQFDTPAKATSGRLRTVDSGHEHGTVSPGGILSHNTGGSTAAASPQDGSALTPYRDVHITGSEPRVWPGVISSSMKRQSSAHEMDRAAEQQQQH
jgi:AMP deaminase